LVQCDESIKAIIERIDQEKGNTIIIETLDDETLLINSSRLPELKQSLKVVSIHGYRSHSNR